MIYFYTSEFWMLIEKLYKLPNLYFENITIFTKLFKEWNTLEYYYCHSNTKKDDSIIKVWIYFSNSHHHFSNYIHLKYIPKTVRTQNYWLNHYFIYVVCIKVVMHLIFKNISKSRTINLKKKNKETIQSLHFHVWN